MSSKYTSEDVALLVAIRADILKNPAAYDDGAMFLRVEYGPDRLRMQLLADWDELNSNPGYRELNRQTAEHASKGIADPAQRNARYQEALEAASALPSPKEWSPGACVCRAIQGLSDAHGREHHDVKAKAILLLGVMLWDADADKRHPIFTMFGSWGVTPAGEVESISRWAATYFLDEEADLRRWMETVRTSWTALGRHVKPNAEIPRQPEFAELLQICDQAIGKYAVLRRAIFDELVRMKSLSGRPWHILYARDPAEGDPSIPAKLSYHTLTNIYINGQPFDGVGQAIAPETYAPIKSFELKDLEGNRPSPGSEAERSERQMFYWLDATLSAARDMTKALHLIQLEAGQRTFKTDIQSLTRLELKLPVFPYWPCQPKDLTREDLDRILAEEKPLLDEARLTLRQVMLEVSMGMAFKGESPHNEVANSADTLEPNSQGQRTDARHDDSAAEVRVSPTTLSKEAKALAALTDHPEWTDADIAIAAGCARSSLYRMKKFVAAKKLLGGGKVRFPTGTKDGETGDIEAWD